MLIAIELSTCNIHTFVCYKLLVNIYNLFIKILAHAKIS